MFDSKIKFTESLEGWNGKKSSLDLNTEVNIGIGTKAETSIKISDLVKEEKESNLVAYCDGGCKPNPGKGGWGIHAYIYKEKEGRQGNGHNTHVLTNEGYLLKADYKTLEQNKDNKIKEIEAVSYLEVFGNVEDETNNNRMEVLALINALKIASLNSEDINSILIYSDSQYTIQRFFKLDLIERHNWLVNDEPVKNRDLLETLLEYRKEVDSKGVAIRLEKIEGHAGDPGNEAADTLASIAVATRINGEIINYNSTTTPAKGFWRVENERHPLLSLPSTYFNTNPSLSVEGLYFLGNHGRKSEMLGTRQTDGAYAIVKLKEPDNILETVRKTAFAKSQELNTYTIILAHLDKLFNQINYKLVNEFGEMVLLSKPNTQSQFLLSTRASALYAESLEPTLLAWRAFKEYDLLNDVYNYYKADKNFIYTKDISDLFYDVEEKSKRAKKGEDPITETLFTLKKELGTTIKKLDLKTKGMSEGKEVDLDITLIFGIDLPSRNHLKRLEPLKPKIELVTWQESPNAYRFATIIHTDEGYGIWSGVYSNYILKK